MISLLEGIRVLDITTLLGASCTTKLSDLGADVIRIETPPHGDYMRGIPPMLPELGVGLNYVMLNRNKRSIGLDLASQVGRRIFLELLATADAVVENRASRCLGQQGVRVRVTQGHQA